MASNQPKQGRRYNDIIAIYLERRGYDKIADAPVRSKLLRIIDNREAVEQWYYGLDPAQRARWSHPDTILKQWTASLNSGVKETPQPNKVTNQYEEQVKELESAVVAWTGRTEEWKARAEAAERKLRDLEFEPRPTSPAADPEANADMEIVQARMLEIARERDSLREKVRQLEQQLEQAPASKPKKAIVFEAVQDLDHWIVQARPVRRGRPSWYKYTEETFASEADAKAAIERFESEPCGEGADEDANAAYVIVVDSKLWRSPDDDKIRLWRDREAADDYAEGFFQADPVDWEIEERKLNELDMSECVFEDEREEV